MKEIKVHNEIVATSEYDVLGRQTKLIDVNAGTVEYEYNAFGDVVETINANGEIKTYTYDDYGRLEQTNNNGIIVNYEYVETGNGINEIEKISTNDHEELFEYDGLNRVVKTTEVIYGEYFEFEFEYNSLNQVVELTYPNGLKVNNVYDNNDNGYLVEVKDQSGNIFWKGEEQDALGRFVEYKKGDNVTTELFYDALKYGLSNSLSDFAYSDSEYYLKRSIKEHTGIFFSGFINGGTQYSSPFLSDAIGSNLGGFGLSMAGYSLEYHNTVPFQGKDPLSSKNFYGLPQKTSIMTFKSFFFNILSIW